LGYHDGYEMIMHAILGGQPPAMPRWTTKDWCKQFYKCNDKRSIPYLIGRTGTAELDKASRGQFQCEGTGGEIEGELSPCYGEGVN
jgi:hypothetical protein